MYDLIKRIKYLREKHGLSQAAFAAKIGVSQGNVGDWERHRSSPSLTALGAIVKAFNVSADWLLFGEEANSQETKNEEHDKDEITELIKVLSEEERKELKVIIEFLRYRRSKEEEKQTEKPPSKGRRKQNDDMEVAAEMVKEEETVYLPLLGSAAAGRPILVNEVLEGYVPVNKEFVRGKTFIVRAKGDSMVGAGINDGDLVVVRHQPVVEQGEAALVRISDEATIKYFHQSGDRVILTSANPKYKPIEVQADRNFAVIGKVIHVIKKEEGEARLRDFHNE